MHNPILSFNLNDFLYVHKKFIKFSETLLENSLYNAKLYLNNRGITDDEIKAYLSTISGVALGSDAFFPFDDNIERAHLSGVSYVAEPGGSIRDDIVISTCDKYGMVMCFTGMRLFHH